MGLHALLLSRTFNFINSFCGLNRIRGAAGDLIVAHLALETPIAVDSVLRVW